MSQMQQYQTLIADVLNNGVDIYNERTQSICRTLVGAQMIFDLQEGFPAVTTRKLPFKSIVGELLGFFRGYQSAAEFRALGCGFWNGNANETRAWLDNPFRTGQDDVGHIYGKQWTAWESTQYVKTGERHKEQLAYLTKNGYTSIAEITNTSETHLQGAGTYTVMIKKINQLEEAARKVLMDPSDRRIIVTGWNPGEYLRQSLPACFTQDALVAVRDGYRYISAVAIGDEVITHEGRLKRVTNVSKVPYNGDMIRIKAKCITHEIECTPEHPFFLKDKGWVKAQDITCVDFLAVRKVVPGEDRIYRYKKSNTKENIVVERKLTPDDYFMLGYFLGNGWLSERRHTISFSIPNKKLERIVEKLQRSLPVYHVKTQGVNCSNYEIRSCELSQLFAEFGKYAKLIPEWVFSSTKESMLAFIEGYFEADGHTDKFGCRIATTTSLMLAHGIQRLATATGILASIVYQKRPPTCYIQGRLVNQSDTYSISLPAVRNNEITQDDNFFYIPVRDVVSYPAQEFVYNLTVEGDNTYTVNNVVTHNCHVDYRFIPIEAKNTMSVVMTLRSADTFLGTPANITSTALFLEVMCRLTGYQADKVIIQAANVHLYENHFAVAKDLVSRAPLPDPKLMLSDSVKRIDSLDQIVGCFERIEPQHFALEGYESHGVLSAPMVA